MSTSRTPVSERKRDANRANAQHSTGPRTEQGKANSSHNALIHGLLAADAVNFHLADPNDRAQFDQLVDQMQRLYQPVGLMEELMVQKIAIAAWRLKKALRFEAQTSFEIWRINREVGDARKAMAMGTTEAGDLIQRTRQHRADLEKAGLNKPNLPSVESTNLLLRYEAGANRDFVRCPRAIV